MFAKFKEKKVGKFYFYIFMICLIFSIFKIFQFESTEIYDHSLVNSGSKGILYEYSQGIYCEAYSGVIGQNFGRILIN
jgi:hypothetical protein